LLFPIQWEASIAHQAGSGEPWRLAAIKNGFSDIWGEEREPDDARKIGSFYPVPPENSSPFILAKLVIQHGHPYFNADGSVPGKLLFLADIIGILVSNYLTYIMPLHPSR